MFTDTSCQQVNIPVTLSFYMCYLCVFPLSLEHSTSAGGEIPTHVWCGGDLTSTAAAMHSGDAKPRPEGLVATVW